MQEAKRMKIDCPKCKQPQDTLLCMVEGISPTPEPEPQCLDCIKAWFGEDRGPGTFEIITANPTSRKGMMRRVEDGMWQVGMSPQN